VPPELVSGAAWGYRSKAPHTRCGGTGNHPSHETSPHGSSSTDVDLPRRNRMVATPKPQQIDLGEYKYGFRDEEDYVFKSEKGLSREVVENISKMKGEPEWMLEYRLKSLDHWNKRPMPNWGSPEIHEIDFDDIYYYIRPAEKMGKTWDEVPEYIKDTFEKLGIPEAERKFLAGVGAQYESEVIYHSLREDLEKQGVIFLDMDSAVNEH